MKKIFTPFCILILFSIAAYAQPDVTFTGPGCNGGSTSGNWTVPCNVTSITVEVYGGGGGAGGGGGGSNGGFFDGRGGAGGGGGGYTTITINVTPGSSFSYSAGRGGCGGDGNEDGQDGDNGAAGLASSFSGTDAGGNAIALTANGGARGTGGDGTEGSPGSGGAGGGASGGSTNTTGTNGSNGSNGDGGPGGAGAGPAGGAGGPTRSANGSTYGGGGAGGFDSDGGNGAAGAVLITFVTTTPLPDVPTITSTPATCVAEGSSTISNYDPLETYTFTPAGPTVGAGGIISGMTTGVSYTVEAGIPGCTSGPSASFSNAPITAPPATPTVSTTPPACGTDGISTITNYDGALSYTFTPLGPTVGAGGVISGMTPGTGYTVVADDGSCSSAASTSFSNGAALPAPAVPTVTTTPPTCSAEGSSTITNYDGALSYAFDPTGPTVGAGGAITGMVTGTSYTVEANDGSCPSGPSASFVNGAQTAAPAIPTIATTPPTCSADGSSAITNYDGALSYTFNPTGPAVGAGGAITGMVTGTSYTVEASDGSCPSGASASFSNSAQFPAAVASISGLLNYCLGGNTTLTASGGTGFAWTDGGGNNIGNTASVTVTQGNYTVVVTDGNGCTDDTTVSVTEVSSLPVTINGTLSFCPGTSTSLTASGGTSYTWSNTGSGETITVTAAGTYTVTASDGGCTGTDSVTVTEFATTPLNLGGAVTACADSTVVLDAGSGFNGYAWSTGDTTQTTSPQASGTYTVTVVDGNGCDVSGTVAVVFNTCAREYEMYIPTAFSPNGDGKNDRFRVFTRDIQFMHVQVFNRWGELVFSTTNPSESWDGSHNGEEAPLGVFAYQVKAVFNDGVERNYNGSVTLVR